MKPSFQCCVLLLLSMLFTAPVYAVPSFSRQTGLACNMCHTTFPELTPFGRQFKLNGYTMAGMQQITAPGGKKTAGLSINEFLPLSGMFLISHSGTKRTQPGTQNGDTEFPQALSLFLAGAMTPRIGAFMQVTYSLSSEHFSMDNTDIRFTNRGKWLGKDAVYGITLNNNPTVEDLWHSTPAWGFPWVASDNAPTPTASPVISGLAADVAGAGAYGMLDNHWYGDLSLYRTAHLGGPQPPNGTGFPFNISGIAPYWRFAYQKDSGNDRFMLGTFGMEMNSIPGAITGLRDRYVDGAADTQYEHQLGPNLISAHASFVRERSKLNNTLALGAAALAIHHFNQFRADATYHIGNRFAATGGGFNITGTKDPVLFAPAPITGSADASPDSTGYIAQLSYWARQNVELAAQYTIYTKFNGGSRNYDGFGRNASDNNTIYLAIWLVF